MIYDALPANFNRNNRVIIYNFIQTIIILFECITSYNIISYRKKTIKIL